MTSFAFWTVSLLFPLFLVVLNAALRWGFGRQQSAGADVVVILQGLSGLVLVQTDEALRFCTLFSDAATLRSWFLFVLFINIGFWWWAAFRIEDILAAAHVEMPEQRKPPVWGMIQLVLCSTLAFLLNTAPFTLG